jgi:hypothetical protein
MVFWPEDVYEPHGLLQVVGWYVIARIQLRRLRELEGVDSS